MKRAAILAVDDDSLMLAWLEVLLGREGFEFLSAPGTQEALEVLARRRPDLLIVDVGMPPPGGLELCRLVRARPDLQGVPIMVHTGSEMKQHSDNGLYDFALQKGSDAKVLMRAIRELLTGQPGS